MKFIQKFDYYAQGIDVNLAGKQKQQTTFGGIVSLGCYIIILI
jgi:hypothetical protein